MQEAGDHEHHADHAPQTTLFTLERTIAQRREAMQQPSGEGLVAECTAFRIIQLVRGGCSLIFEVKVLLWVSLATLVLVFDGEFAAEYVVALGCGERRASNTPGFYQARLACESFSP